MPLFQSRIRLIGLIGFIAILFIVGIGFVAVDAKQVICRNDVYSSNWLFNWLRRDLCSFGSTSPLPPPNLYFNYAEAQMAPGDVDNIVSMLQSGNITLNQLPAMFHQLVSVCTFSADASSSIRLRVNGAPSPPAAPGQGNISFAASQLPTPSCPMPMLPQSISTLQTNRGLVLNQQITAGQAEMVFQQSGTPVTLNTQRGFLQLTVTQYDNTAGGTVRAAFGLLLRDVDNPGNVVLVINGAIAVSV